MQEIRRIHILKPPGQQFAIGDKVKLKTISGYNQFARPNAHFRITCSHGQHVENIWFRQSLNPDEPKLKVRPDFRVNEYTIMDTETGSTQSWIPVDDLERVPETLTEFSEMERDLSQIRKLFRSLLNKETALTHMHVVRRLTTLRDEVSGVLESRLACIEEGFIEKDDGDIT